MSTSLTRSDQVNALRQRLAVAWSESRLAELPPHFREILLPLAGERTFAPGETVRWDRPLLVVMMSGQLCVYMSSIERRAAMRYLRRGDMVGLMTVFIPDLAPTHLPIVIRAVTTCRVMELPPARFAALAQRDGKVAWRVGQWLAHDIVAGHTVLADDIFLSVRQLIARHLLDLASPRQGKLVVDATQQDLADAVGSVRAVVGRILSEFRDEGLVVREGRSLLLLDRDGLAQIASAE